MGDGTAAEDHTLSLANIGDDIPHEQTNDTGDPAHRGDHSIPLSHDSRPQRLDNTLKPSTNLSRDMSLTEADTWLKGFTAWFEWNASIHQ